MHKVVEDKYGEMKKRHEKKDDRCILRQLGDALSLIIFQE